MLQTLKPNAQLDLLTKEELQQVASEMLSGYLRPEQRIRNPAGVDLDGTGAGTVAEAYRVEAGMRFVLTRMEVSADGYTARSPYSPMAQGGIDIYVNGQWRDGTPFGASTGFIIPLVYTQSESRAIVAEDGDVFTVLVAGGPASTGLLVALCGILEPMIPVV